MRLVVPGVARRGPCPQVTRPRQWTRSRRHETDVPVDELWNVERDEIRRVLSFCLCLWDGTHWHLLGSLGVSDTTCNYLFLRH